MLHVVVEAKSPVLIRGQSNGLKVRLGNVGWGDAYYIRFQFKEPFNMATQQRAQVPLLVGQRAELTLAVIPGECATIGDACPLQATFTCSSADMTVTSEVEVEVLMGVARDEVHAESMLRRIRGGGPDNMTVYVQGNANIGGDWSTNKVIIRGKDMLNPGPASSAQDGTPPGGPVKHFCDHCGFKREEFADIPVCPRCGKA
jgi:hypothetical protein